jgi:hypothetical protein
MYLADEAVGADGVDDGALIIGVRYRERDVGGSGGFT